MAEGKAYYPYLDLLKFLCCVGIVAIHTQPHYYMPDAVKSGIDGVLGLCVPIFFTISAYLLAVKLDTGNERKTLARFLSRLALLYAVWTVIMSPNWLTDYMREDPENWLAGLPLKIILKGAPHGSWFILGLIYGTVIAIAMNKLLGRAAASILSLAIIVYISLTDAGILPDIIGIEAPNPVVNIHFSPLMALPYVQAGLMLHQSGMLRRAKERLAGIKDKAGKTLIFAAALAVSVFTPLSVRPVCSFAAELVIVAMCSMPRGNKEKGKDFTLLRKMSVMIFFMQFAFASAFGAMAKRGIIDYQFGLREFAVTLFLCLLIACAVARLSERYKVLRYLY